MRTSKYTKSKLMCFASVPALMMAGTAVNAQNADADEDVFEEIIVTVNRREESIQDVAGTVQAFDGLELQRIGVNSEFANLQYAVPGLQIAKQEGKFEVFLRGIGSADSDFSSDPSVATHFNGVYLPRPRGIGPLFFDTQRVEVNKGPQGTVRGRNATGGTINIISNRPDTQEFSGAVMAGVGNFNGRELEAVLNVPLSDTLAIRAAGWHKAHDGLYSNEFIEDLGVTDFTTPSAQDDIAGRLSLRWEPSDRLTVDLFATYSDVQSSGDPGTFSGRALSAGFDIDDLDDPWNQYFRTEGRFDQEIQMYQATVVYDFDQFGVEYNASLTDLDAYNQNASREWQLGMVYPGSELEADFIASGANPQRNLNVNDTFSQGERSESIIQELRFFSTDDGPLQWTAGGFYFKETYDFVSWDIGNGFCGNSNFFGFEAPLGPETISCWQNGLGGESRGDDSEVESIAFYGDATYEISDRLRIKGGIRWTEDEKTQNDFSARYQFTFNSDFFFSQPGINEPSDLVIGSEGLRLAAPGERAGGDTIAVGGDATQLFLDGFSSFGVRDNWDDVLQSCQGAPENCQIIVTDTDFDDPTTADVLELTETTRVKDSFVDWRVGFEYDLSDTQLLYGTVSTGHRSGGINRPIVSQTGVTQATTWDPEKLVVYEIGSKNVFDLNGRRAVLNAAAFYYDYSDRVVQNLVTVPSPTPTNPNATTERVVSDNVGGATVFGVEIDGNFDLPQGFNFGFNLAYLDTEFSDDAENVLFDPRVTNGDPLTDVRGNRLENTSKWNINMRLSQNYQLDGDIVKSFDWTISTLFRSSFFLTQFNNEFPDPDRFVPNNNGALSGIGGPAGIGFFQDTVDSFWLVNFNAGINMGDDEQHRLDFYMENVFEQAFTPKGFINGSVNIRYLNSPRIYGVRFRTRF